MIAMREALGGKPPLKNMLAKYIDKQVMEAIAAEYKKGCRLWIGTVNLDATRPVIRDIGQIASGGHAADLKRIHEVILSSASIPEAFPPVFIEVEAGGRRYGEPHADGGNASQVFLYPSHIDWNLLNLLYIPEDFDLKPKEDFDPG